MIMNRVMLLAVSVLISTTLMAQDKIDDQNIIYKWYENGIAHYAETPPRGVSNYIRLNDQGMVIKERPDIGAFKVIKPLRPDIATKEEANSNFDEQSNNSDEKLVEGAISKQERCATMTKDLKILSEKETIYEEDESGNLVPLDEETIERRKQETQAMIDKVCSE